MLRKRILAAATATVLALGMSVGGAGAALATVPPPADVSPAVVTEECVPQDAVPEIPERSRIEFQRYSWVGGPISVAPSEVPPSANWQANTTNKDRGAHRYDPVGIPFQRGNPGNADWFFWTETRVIEQPFVPAVDEVTCPDPEPTEIFEVGMYIYKKLNPQLPAAWENSDLQTFVKSKTGIGWFSADDFPSASIPDDVCVGGYGLQQDLVRYLGEGSFTWPPTLKYPNDTIVKNPNEVPGLELRAWKHYELVKFLGIDCDLTTEPLASVGFTWTSATCDTAQTVSIDDRLLINATASNPVVSGNTVTFTINSEAGSVFGEDEADAPTFNPADGAPSFTWSLNSPENTVMTVVVTLEPANIELCEEPTFGATIAAGGQCESDVPWIDLAFSIEPGERPLNSEAAFIEFRREGFAPERVNLTNGQVWRIVDGERVPVILPISEAGSYEARALWPGASVDDDGNATGWPGWGFDATSGWFETEENENARWTRQAGLNPDVTLFLSVNPEAEIPIFDSEFTYPQASPLCATDPTPVVPTVEFDYTCETGGVIELSDTPGVLWTVNGEPVEQFSLAGLALTSNPVVVASLDPEMPELYFPVDTTTQWTIEFPEPEEICDFQFPELPIVEASVSSTPVTCDAAGTFTLVSEEGGVRWFVNGVERAAGAYTAITGSTVNVAIETLPGFGVEDQPTAWVLTFPAPTELCPTQLPVLSLDDGTLTELQVTGASGMLGTLGIVALLITLTGIGVVATRRRVEV